MKGDRYASKSYGFPKEVVQFMREWFDDEECGTADTWGRKVSHVDPSGNKE